MDRCIDRMGPGCFFLGYIHAFDVLLRPLFGAIIGLILTTLILTYSLNKKFRIFMDSLSLKSLTLFHAWRIFAGWVFLSFSDRLPQTFINHAAYGDIISGFLALSVFLLMQKKWSYYLFNLVGLVDFFYGRGHRFVPHFSWRAADATHYLAAADHDSVMGCTYFRVYTCCFSSPIR